MKSEDFYASYNETMFHERDVIQHFLEQQFDLRYGNQRGSWHFEPAVKMLSRYGNIEYVTDIMLDKDKFVIFIPVDAREYECFDFAYGELSKVIKALPDADEIVKKNAIDDIATELELRGNIVWTTGQKHIIGDGFDVIMVTGRGNDAKVILRKCDVNSEPIMLKNLSSMELKQLRDHIRVSILHGYDEYKKLVKFLSEQPNLCFEPANFGDVEFTIHGTDVKVDVLSASLDANDKLQLCVKVDNKEPIYLEEKDIRPEYLVNLVGYIEDNCICDIMDTYNGHNAELVRKINKAWKNGEYHGRFGDILFALGSRDKQEIQDKLDVVIDCNETAMNNAHQILEGVCDDWDLETILSFIRYEE
jgi:hypothetical protein